MRLVFFVPVLVTALPLASCGEKPNPCLSAPDVKQCEATRAAVGGGQDNSLLYGLGGYMLGRMGSGGGSSATHTRTVERHYYSTPRSTPVTSPTRYVSTPSYRSSSFTSRPSYSFRSSSVSFGGRR